MGESTSAPARERKTTQSNASNCWLPCTQIRKQYGIALHEGPTNRTPCGSECGFRVPNEKFQFPFAAFAALFVVHWWQRLCALDALALTDGVDRVGHHVVWLSGRNNDILKNFNGILQLGRMGTRHAGSRAKPRPRLVCRKLV